MSSHIKKALLIANPVAQNGKGTDACRYVVRILTEMSYLDQLDVVLTNGPKHGQAIAECAHDFDTVIVLGGDGLVHEVVNGLMVIPSFCRPQLALLPSGTGNDYARTLGMSFLIEESVQELFATKEHLFDLGMCNEEYFAETLSFGLDADIALDTVERRIRTGKTGTALFIESGIDVCIAHPPLSVPKATAIFLLAKNAHHTRFKQIELVQAQAIELEFFDDEQLPIQIDGERLKGSRFTVTCVPSALRVLTTW